LNPLRVFISYSRVDEEIGLLKEFLIHLQPMVRDKLIEPWHDRRITPGAEWAGKIDEHLSNAQLVILLVSPDFLASDYCNDVEMTKAMELHSTGEARVVPVILRPCDWQTSRFAALQVLPTDGTPVIKWVPKEDGFLDVAKGLRRVVRNADPGEIPPKQVLAKSSRRPLPFAIVALLIVAAAFLWWRPQAAWIAEGDKELDTGRYDLAAKYYDRAVRWNPFNSRARIGSAIVSLAQCRSDFEACYSELRRLRAEAPANPYLEIIEGQFLLLNDREGKGHEEAMPHFRKAAKLKPDLAEAYFYQGVVLEYWGDRSGALSNYSKARHWGPGTAKYRLNIAALMEKSGDFSGAEREYQTIARLDFPLADLNLSQVDRLLGQMDAARTSGLNAVALLERAAIANSPQNSGGWAFEVKDGKVILPSQKTKLCYAQLSLGATLFLLGEKTEARRRSSAAAKDCSADFPSLTEAIAWELGRLTEKHPNTKQPVEEYLSVSSKTTTSSPNTR